MDGFSDVWTLFIFKNEPRMVINFIFSFAKENNSPKMPEV